MLLKNAIQKIHVYAYDSTTGAAKTGDAANITAYVSLDGTANAIDDTNPAEVDATNMPGVYVFDLTAAETNCDSFALYAKSATSNIRIEPIIGFTTAGTSTSLSANVIAIAANAINAAAIADDAIAAAKVKADAVTKIQAGLATPTNITAGTITTVTNLTNLPAITDNWLTAAGIAASALDGKGNWNVGKTGYSMTGTITTLDALNTSLSSTHGAASWATATGFSTHSASDVVTALGTGSTLTALATATNLATVAGYLDTEIAAILVIANKLDTTMVQDGGVYDFTAASLAAAPTGGSAPTVTQIRQEMDTNSTKLSAILEDTGTTLPATVPTATAIADAILVRDLTTASLTAAKYSLCTYMLCGLNSSISGTTRTVLKPDDTPHYTFTVTTDAAAIPITGQSGS